MADMPANWDPMPLTPQTREQKWNHGPVSTGMRIAFGVCLGITVFFLVWTVLGIAVFSAIAGGIASR